MHCWCLNADADAGVECCWKPAGRPKVVEEHFQGNLKRLPKFFWAKLHTLAGFSKYTFGLGRLGLLPGTPAGFPKYTFGLGAGGWAMS